MSDDVHAVDLTRFKLDILAVLAEEPNYGLGIIDELEEYYGEEVLHGRLYPNLDDLVELNLVEKSELDKRTNEYELTKDGWSVVHSRAAWLGSKLNLDDDHRLAGAKPATPSTDARTDGGEGEDDDEDRTLGEEMADAAERAGLFDDDGGDA